MNKLISYVKFIEKDFNMGTDFTHEGELFRIQLTNNNYYIPPNPTKNKILTSISKLTFDLNLLKIPQNEFTRERLKIVKIKHSKITNLINIQRELLLKIA
jgi:hypothetical protein